MASESRYSAATLEDLARVLDWVDGAVMGFLFLSGYLFKPPAGLLPYVKKQALRLLLPYFIFSTADAVLLAALGKGDLWAGLLATAGRVQQALGVRAARLGGSRAAQRGQCGKALAACALPRAARPRAAPTTQRG